MGEITIKLKATAITALLVCGLAFCGSASAGTASVGDSFPIGYLAMPPNSVPGSNSGTMGPGYIQTVLSTDGRYAFLSSDSDNLGGGYSPDSTNIFRKDKQTGDLVLVNRADGVNGSPINASIYSFATNGDGNLFVFATDNKVVPADTDDKYDIYIRNIQAGTTTLATPAITENAYSPDVSDDGNYIAFVTSQSLYPGDTNGAADVYRTKLSDGTSEIVSATSGTTTASNDGSDAPSISGNGKWVTFNSKSTNLIGAFIDNNGPSDRDIFLRNMDADTTYLVSAKYNAANATGNDEADESQIAGNPDTLAQVMVAYGSYSTNLADNAVTDTAGDSSVYFRSMALNPSELISRATGPAGANADSRAHTPSISDDGSRIVFSSDATNLGPAPDYYGVYLRDRGTSTTSLVSAKNHYAVQGLISGDGQTGTWAESGGATEDSDPVLASVFRRSLPSGQIELVSRPKGTKLVRSSGFQTYETYDRSLSATGRYLVFATISDRLPGFSEDRPDTPQVYRRDLKTGNVELASRSSGSNGVPSEGAYGATVSSDGNLVAFRCEGALVAADTNDKVDVYVRNMKTGVTTLVSRADGANGAVADESSGAPQISGDGRRVAFSTDASNLGAPGTNFGIYVRDIQAGKTMIASRATGEAGVLANDDSDYASISYDGSKVAFSTYSTNLDPDDPSNNNSVYVRNLDTSQTQLVSRAPGLTGTSLPNYNNDPVISGNGGRVAFVTYDEIAVPATAPWPVGVPEVVVRQLSDGSNSLVSIAPGGQPADDYSSSPSLSRDGNVVAFETSATNLREDIDNTGYTNIVVRNMTTGKNTGPPIFGILPYKGTTRDPVVSDSGDCVSFSAQGHNDVSGDLGDLYTPYMFVNSGTCLNPLKLTPKISGLKLKPAKFRVSPKATAKVSARRAPRGTKIGFTLNTVATVTIRVEQKVKRKGKKKFVLRGKLVRKNLAAGRRTVPFSGRIGRKALKPGNYRVVLQARTATDKSNRPARPFRIVR